MAYGQQIGRKRVSAETPFSGSSSWRKSRQKRKLFLCLFDFEPYAKPEIHQVRYRHPTHTSPAVSTTHDAASNSIPNSAENRIRSCACKGRKESHRPSSQDRRALSRLKIEVHSPFKGAVQKRSIAPLPRIDDSISIQYEIPSRFATRPPKPAAKQNRTPSESRRYR